MGKKGFLHVFPPFEIGSKRRAFLCLYFTAEMPLDFQKQKEKNGKLGIGIHWNTEI
jgi:hypothetical protein